MSSPPHYDLVVIGSGPSGEKAAVKAAYFKRKVALVERETLFGGAGVNTGTLPSKTLKETALYLSGKNDKGVYGVERALGKATTIEDFLFRQKHVCSTIEAEVRANLERHKVDIYHGIGSFDDAHTIRVSRTGADDIILTADHTIIATGSYPFHPPGMPFDHERVHDSDTILELKFIPHSLCIVGAGVIGCEYATIFATMGTKVHLVNDRDKILGFVDEEVALSLVEQMRLAGIEILFNAEVLSVTAPSPDQPVCIKLKSGAELNVEMFLFAAGRSGSTADLHCDRAGVVVGKREQIPVDAEYRTNVPHIFAVGDVIGFPSLASTGMDQGRVAVTHILETHDLDSLAKLFPYGIYTIPEVSMVGMTEQDAIKANLSYCTGKASHARTARGLITGTTNGYLKLVFLREGLVIIGVHIIGHLASELIHFGLSLVSEKKTVLEVISVVFNYPTLHDLYKYACYDGLGNLSGHKIKAE